MGGADQTRAQLPDYAFECVLCAVCVRQRVARICLVFTLNSLDHFSRHIENGVFMVHKQQECVLHFDVRVFAFSQN